MDEISISKKWLSDLDDEQFEQLLLDPLVRSELERLGSLWREIETATSVSFTEELAMELVQLVDTMTNDAVERMETTSRREAEEITKGVQSHLMSASALLNRMRPPLRHVIFNEGGSDLEHTRQLFADFDFALKRTATSASEVRKGIDHPQIASLCRINSSGKKGRRTNDHVDRFVLTAADIYEEAVGHPTASKHSASEKIDGPFPRLLKVLWSHCWRGDFRHHAPCGEDTMLRRARDVSLPIYRGSKKL